MPGTKEQLAQPCLLKSQQDKADQLSTALLGMLKANDEKLQRKVSSLVAKMQGSSMVAFATDKPDSLKAMVAMGAGCDDKAGDLKEKLWVIGHKPFSISWEPNSFPFPGVPSCIVGLRGIAYVRIYSLATLLAAGMSATGAFHSFLSEKKEDFEKSSVLGPLLLEKDTMLWVPAGHVPFIVPAYSLQSGKEKQPEPFVFMYKPCFLKSSMATLPASTSSEVKHHLARTLERMCAGESASKTWTESKALLTEWAGTF